MTFGQCPATCYQAWSFVSASSYHSFHLSRRQRFDLLSCRIAIIDFDMQPDLDTIKQLVSTSVTDARYCTHISLKCSPYIYLALSISPRYLSSSLPTTISWQLVAVFYCGSLVDEEVDRMLIRKMPLLLNPTVWASQQHRMTQAAAIPVCLIQSTGNQWLEFYSLSHKTHWAKHQKLIERTNLYQKALACCLNVRVRPKS